MDKRGNDINLHWFLTFRSHPAALPPPNPQILHLSARFIKHARKSHDIVSLVLKLNYCYFLWQHVVQILYSKVKYCLFWKSLFFYRHQFLLDKSEFSATAFIPSPHHSKKKMLIEIICFYIYTTRQIRVTHDFYGTCLWISLISIFWYQWFFLVPQKKCRTNFRIKNVSQNKFPFLDLSKMKLQTCCKTSFLKNVSPHFPTDIMIGGVTFHSLLVTCWNLLVACYSL